MKKDNSARKDDMSRSSDLGALNDVRLPSRATGDGARNTDFKMQLELDLTHYCAGKVDYRTFPTVDNNIPGFRCVLTISKHVAGRGFALTEEEAQQKAAAEALSNMQSGKFKLSLKKM